LEDGPMLRVLRQQSGDDLASCAVFYHAHVWRMCFDVFGHLWHVIVKNGVTSASISYMRMPSCHQSTVIEYGCWSMISRARYSEVLHK
jgi:hypothetical protein